jgi:hypothetical protein
MDVKKTMANPEWDTGDKWCAFLMWVVIPLIIGFFMWLSKGEN